MRHTTYLFEVGFTRKNGHTTYRSIRATDHNDAKLRIFEIYDVERFNYCSRIGN